jgi:uncharacterized protein
MKIVNKTRNCVLAEQAQIADSFLARAKGLLGRDSLPTGQALVITSCRGIHTYFMRFPIDVLFVDKKSHVVGMVHTIEPNKTSPYFWKASFCIEFPAKTLKPSGTDLDDFIEILQ